MSDHCARSAHTVTRSVRTYYLLHFNYRAASRTVIFEMGPSIPVSGSIWTFTPFHAKIYRITTPGSEIVLSISESKVDSKKHGD